LPVRSRVEAISYLHSFYYRDVEKTGKSSKKSLFLILRILFYQISIIGSPRIERSALGWLLVKNDYFTTESLIWSMPSNSPLADIIRSKLRKKWVHSERCAILSTSSPFFNFPQRSPLQQECDDGNNHEDYHEPFCDFHRETGYSPCSQYECNQGKDQKNYREIN
jgi:hypothetical protein